MKIPFSAYDFFGYLASGFLLVTTVDYAFQLGVILEVTAVNGHVKVHKSGRMSSRRLGL